MKMCCNIKQSRHNTMVLYFVCKLKLVSNKPSKTKRSEKNKISLLCFSSNDEEAWTMVQDQAKSYLTKKNAKLCDQTNKSENTIVREIYKLKEPKESEDKHHTIEVVKQWREKGWISTEYKELKIAEFSMTRFKGELPQKCDYCELSIGNTPDQQKPDLKAIASVLGTTCCNPQLLKDLRNSDLFRERIRQVEKYSRYTGIDDDLTESVETE